MNVKLITITISGLCAALMVVSMTTMSDNGKAGYAGAPSESTCASCHNSYNLNSTGGAITIASSPTFTNGEYIPGQVYTMTVNVARTGGSVFGIDVEVLTATNTNAGTLGITNSSETHIKNSFSTSSFSTITNVVHQLNGGLATNSKNFSFSWIAPASGAVTFYATGIAGNNSGDEFGDYVYSTSLALNASTTSGINNIITEFDELKIYPSPASHNFNISYKLQQPSDVVCALMTMNGDLIMELINQKQCMGFQNTNIELPTTIAKGIYFIRLSVNGQHIQKKIIITK